MPTSDDRERPPQGREPALKADRTGRLRMSPDDRERLREAHMDAACDARIGAQQWRALIAVWKVTLKYRRLEDNALVAPRTGAKAKSLSEIARMHPVNCGKALRDLHTVGLIDYSHGKNNHASHIRVRPPVGWDDDVTSVDPADLTSADPAYLRSVDPAYLPSRSFPAGPPSEDTQQEEPSAGAGVSALVPVAPAPAEAVSEAEPGQEPWSTAAVMAEVVRRAEASGYPLGPNDRSRLTQVLPKAMEVLDEVATPGPAAVACVAYWLRDSGGGRWHGSVASTIPDRLWAAILRPLTPEEAWEGGWEAGEQSRLRRENPAAAAALGPTKRQISRARTLKAIEDWVPKS